jgi:hypothetical protein
MLRPGAPHAALPVLAGALAALMACSSSSSPNPPQLGTCVPKDGVPCGATTPGGGTSPPSDAGVAPAPDTGVATAGCPGATQIFNAAASSCATCVENNCCSSSTSCPNDPACLSVAVCVATSCLQNDQSCLVTCEGASPPGTITEYIDFQQCVGASCPGCPALGGGDL